MICIQICSKLEWASTKNIMKITEDLVDFTPYGEYISKNIMGRECILFHSGATKTKSSGGTQYAIDKWNPEILFVLGTCGGVSENLKTLDIVIANRTVQYDCITGMSGPNQMFFEYFIEDIDNSWIDYDKLSINIYEGLVATADQDVGNRQIDKLRRENVLCADWESGAISHICKINKVKCCILRGITDVPDKNDLCSDNKQASDYKTNTPIVMEKLINVVLSELINQLVGITN